MDSIETRLHDAKLGAAIENAAGNLPEGWEINVNIERNGYGVSLFDPHGEHVEIEGAEGIAEDINKAVAEAIAIDSTDDE